VAGSGGGVGESAIGALPVHPVPGPLAIESVAAQQAQGCIQRRLAVAAVALTFAGVAVYLVTAQHQAAQGVLHHRVDSIQCFVRTAESAGLGKICGNQVTSDIPGCEFTLRGIPDQNVPTAGIVKPVLECLHPAAAADVFADLVEAVQPGQLPILARRAVIAELH